MFYFVKINSTVYPTGLWFNLMCYVWFKVFDEKYFIYIVGNLFD